MALSIAERKERLPHGANKEIAGRLRAFPSYISAVMAGEVRPKTKRTKLKLRRAQVLVAQAIGLAVEDVFSADELALAQQAQPLAKAS